MNKLSNLFGFRVILKLCQLLGSRSISVREVARKTLIQVRLCEGKNELRWPQPLDLDSSYSC